MRKRDLIAVSCRILGLWFLVQAILQLPAFLNLVLLAADSDWPPGGDSLVATLLTNVGELAVLILSAAILLREADPIAARLVPEEENAQKREQGDSLFGVALKTVGLYVLITSAHALLRVVASVLSAAGVIQFQMPWRMDLPIEAVALVLRIGLGWYLLAGGAALVRISSRTNALREPSDPLPPAASE